MALPSLGNPYVRGFPHRKRLLLTKSAAESRPVRRWMLLSHHVSAVGLSLKDTNDPQTPQNHTAAAADWQGICMNLFSLIFQAEMHVKLAAPFPRAVPGYFTLYGLHKHISIWSIHKATCTGSAQDHIQAWLHAARSHWMWQYSIRYWSRVNQTESTLPWASEVMQ